MGARRRRWLLAVLGVAALGVATAGARWWAGEEVLRALDARSVQWDSQHHTFTTVHLSGLQWKGARAAEVDVVLVPAPRVIVRQADLDLKALQSAGGAPGSGGVGHRGSLSSVVAVEVEALDIRLGDDTIAENWSGSLLPSVDIGGAGGQLSKTLQGEWTVRLDRALRLGPASGQGRLSATCGERCTVTLEVPALVLEHPFLASEPLPPVAARAELDWDLHGDGALSGTLALGGLMVDAG